MGLKYYISEKLRELKNEKNYAKQRYKNLSLQELDAYEEIVKRDKPVADFIVFPYCIMRFIFSICVFSICMCYVYGIEFEYIRANLITIIEALASVIPLLFGLLIISYVILRISHNRFKIKILNRN